MVSPVCHFPMTEYMRTRALLETLVLQDILVFILYALAGNTTVLIFNILRRSSIDIDHASFKQVAVSALP